MMQKRLNMSVAGIKAKTGGRVGKRMPSAEPSPIVLTIGHSTRTLEDFIGLLQAHGATRVVIDPVGEPGPDCIDVRRSGAMAMPSLAHRRCLAGSWDPHRGHRECNSPPGSHPYSVRQSPGHHDYLSGRGLTKHYKEAIGQMFEATTNQNRLTHTGN